MNIKTLILVLIQYLSDLWSVKQLMILSSGTQNILILVHIYILKLTKMQ